MMHDELLPNVPYITRLCRVATSTSMLVLSARRVFACTVSTALLVQNHYIMASAARSAEFRTER